MIILAQRWVWMETRSWLPQHGTNRGMPINSGTIYAFEYNSGNGLWEEFQEITPSSSSLAQAFGTAMDLHGNTLIASAPFTKKTPREMPGEWLFLHDKMEILLKLRFFPLQILLPEENLVHHSLLKEIRFWWEPTAIALPLVRGEDRSINSIPLAVHGHSKKILCLRWSVWRSIWRKGCLLQGNAVATAPLDDDKGTSSGSAYFSPSPLPRFSIPLRWRRQGAERGQ